MRKSRKANKKKEQFKKTIPSFVSTLVGLILVETIVAVLSYFVIKSLS